MRTLIVGGGAREHALGWSCMKADSGVQLHFAPGNGGTALLGHNVPLQSTEATALAAYAREQHIDLVIAGTDAALAAGVVNACRSAGITAFGPTQEAARIESSKSFAKSMMQAAGVETAPWTVGCAADRAELLSFAAARNYRCVVKADGLALGKGVLVCTSEAEVDAALRACFVERRFGSSGDRIVIEELLEGREVSLLAFTDGSALRYLPPACDYKRQYSGDRGPNTGGMGACTPPPGMDAGALISEADEKVFSPLLQTMQHHGHPFTGCLYAGLMLTPAGMRVLEFNARFGDPEAEVILPVMSENLLQLCIACAQGNLPPGRVSLESGHCAVAVVLASSGYPGTTETGRLISGDLETIAGTGLLFHGGTEFVDGRWRTSGGRVLTAVGTGETLERAAAIAYGRAGTVSFAGMQYRDDIAAPEVAKK